MGRAIFFRDRTSVRALILRDEQHFFKGKGLDATVTKNGVYNMRSMATNNKTLFVVYFFICLVFIPTEPTLNLVLALRKYFFHHQDLLKMKSAKYGGT